MTDRNDIRARLERIESLQNMLIARATGSYPEDSEYAEVRQELLQDEQIRAQLPGFVKTCRSLDQFWGYIKGKYGTYAERRTHIWDSFSPLVQRLEQGDSSPVEVSVEQLLQRVSYDSVHVIWTKALDRRSTEPEGAITLARTLLETVCKHVIEESQGDLDKHLDLPKLYRQASELLNIAPTQHSEQVFRKILGGCTSVVEGLGSLRNQLSDAHGQGRRRVKPAARHAELAVNLAGAMATFLLATHESRQDT